VSCREASIRRDTAETSVQTTIAIDGTGTTNIHTGIHMFDHFLTQVASHGLFDLVVEATGDDQHHVIEDVAICLGKALNEALGEKRGLTRMSHAMVPMDESLATVAIDLSGRPGAYVSLPFSTAFIGDLEADMVRHFLITFAIEGRLTLHAHIDAGVNDHHKAEAVFKALARSLDGACRIDSRRANHVPSSKGLLEH
jgi:imidazoleglycerol-phosphate dehydratase